MSGAKFLDEIFNNVDLKAKVIEIYDGDTCTIETEFPGVVHRDSSTPLLIKFKVRMMGYDTPELRTRNLNEKRLGYICKQVLSNKILNEDVTIKCKSLDKYGRLLGTIICKNEDINEYMIVNNYGMTYDGGTKKDVIYNEDNSYVIDGVTYRLSAME